MPVGDFSTEHFILENDGMQNDLVKHSRTPSQRRLVKEV